MVRNRLIPLITGFRLARRNRRGFDLAKQDREFINCTCHAQRLRGAKVVRIFLKQLSFIEVGLGDWIGAKTAGALGIGNWAVGN
jgi:hypothetical protein